MPASTIAAHPTHALTLPRTPLNAGLHTCLNAEVLREAAGDAGVIDLLKMDADGPEGQWMNELASMLRYGGGGKRRSLRVKTIIVEASFVEPRTMALFQSLLGYTVLRLDVHDSRRRITREGWDAYSTPGTMEPLGRLREEHDAVDRRRCKYSPPGRYRPLADNVSRLELEEEWMAVRAMRHIFRVRPNTSEQGWATILQPVLKCSYPSQFVLTLEPADTLLPEMPGTSPGERESPERMAALQRRPHRRGAS